ncbi:MAG: LuxR C-terminal-related transcriptional regulator [Ignavibacteriaceae bacterium]
MEKHLYKSNSRESKILSERENEVVKLVAKGKTNKEIAEKLFLSIHTIYTHRKDIMRKLKIKSPLELVLYALNAGTTEKK